MIYMKTQVLMAALSCGLLTGCGSLLVPNTKITGTIAGQPFALTCPKDVALTNLEVSASGTNATVKIGGLTTRMNPEVVSMSGEAFVKLINAGAAGAGTIAGAAAKTAAK